MSSIWSYYVACYTINAGISDQSGDYSPDQIACHVRNRSDELPAQKVENAGSGPAVEASSNREGPAVEADTGSAGTGVRGTGHTGVWGRSVVAGHSGVYGQHRGVGFGIVGDGGAPPTLVSSGATVAAGVSAVKAQSASGARARAESAFGASHRRPLRVP
jgi:hypothetical protein